MRPRIRLPHALLAIGLIGLTVLLAVNVTNLFDAPHNWAAVRSDLRTWFFLAVIVGLIWLTHDSDRRATWHTVPSNRAWTVRGHDEPRTQDLGSHLSIVGTAAVAPAPAELSDYDRGFVDGLARKPMPPGKVIPMDGRPHRS